MRLVDPIVATAAVHSVLKSLSGNSSSEHLSARHCFPLEDPPDDIKNVINLEGLASFFVISIASVFALPVLTVGFAELQLRQLSTRLVTRGSKLKTRRKHRSRLSM